MPDECDGDRSIGSCLMFRIRKSPQPNVNVLNEHGLTNFGDAAVVAAAVAAIFDSNCKPLVSGAAAAADLRLASMCFSTGNETTCINGDVDVDDDALFIERSVGC